MARSRTPVIYSGEPVDRGGGQGKGKRHKGKGTREKGWSNPADTGVYRVCTFILVTQSKSHFPAFPLYDSSRTLAYNGAQLPSTSYLYGRLGWSITWRSDHYIEQSSREVSRSADLLDFRGLSITRHYCAPGSLLSLPTLPTMPGSQRVS